MPVKLYVDQDSKGRPSPPHHTHEVNPVLEILNNIWKTFHPDQRTFVAISSLRDPSADLIVLAEVGIGIIELKHCEGVIHRKGSHWYADNRKIKAGSDTLGRKNPHEQVQEYALELRNKLLPSASGKGWLPGSRAEQEKCQFHTAVCFTDPQARLRLIKSDIQINGIETLPWEHFTILTPKLVPAWIASLRFQVTQGPHQGFAHCRLSGQRIVQIAEQLLSAYSWDEAYALMPQPGPYGYLSLRENGEITQVFSLVQDRSLVGRDPTADVPIPAVYTRVGRKHAEIVRDVTGVYLRHLSNHNGSYVNELTICDKLRLQCGDCITLGGLRAGDGVCSLEFSTSTPVTAAETEWDSGE